MFAPPVAIDGPYCEGSPRVVMPINCAVSMTSCTPTVAAARFAGQLSELPSASFTGIGPNVLPTPRLRGFSQLYPSAVVKGASQIIEEGP